MPMNKGVPSLLRWGSHKNGGSKEGDIDPMAGANKGRIQALWRGSGKNKGTESFGSGS